MSAELTPCRPKTSCKRELSSPEDESELKKKKLSEGQEPASAGSSDISDLSIMDLENVLAEGATLGEPPKTEITLKEADLKTIAGILGDTFQPQIKDMIGSIVEGVVKGLTDTINSLQKENQDLKTRVQKLEAKVDAAEQYSRRNCLRIAGVPENPLENTDVYVIDMSRAIDAEVTLDDIERSHRVGPLREGKRRDIIVKFSSYRTRRKVYGARTKTKDCGYMGVFINEDLTKPRNKTLLKARKMVKSKNLSSAWSSDGTILVRDKEDVKHKIVCENDLAAFGPVPKLKGELEQDASEHSGGATAMDR